MAVEERQVVCNMAGIWDGPGEVDSVDEVETIGDEHQFFMNHGADKLMEQSMSARLEFRDRMSDMESDAVPFGAVAVA